MKKTLSAILCALALTTCREKPEREVTEAEEHVVQEEKADSSEKNVAGNSLALMLTPYYSEKSFDELLAEPTLTVEDFLGLIQYVKTPADLETVIKTRNIHYVRKGEENLRKALDTVYGPPLETHNLGSGVCDELAMYSLPFLLNMPEVKNITLVEINSPKKSESDELPSVLVFQDRRGRWHPSEGNKSIVKESYIFQQDAIVDGLHRRGYTVSGNITTSAAQDQSETVSAKFSHNYKTAAVMNVRADTVVKEEALHALVVFQDKKDKWHFYSNAEFSTETYATAGEATTAVAAGIGYLHPESLSSIKTREIRSVEAWLYDTEEAKKLRPADDVCLP